MGIERDAFFASLSKNLTYEPVEKISIGGRMVGKGEPTFIIAEVGANHHGKLEDALNAIKAAAEAGADAIKFQHITHNKIAADTPIQTGDGTKPLSELYASMDTPNEWTQALIEAARASKIQCFSSPFDKAAADLLESLDVPAFKIASCELTDDLLVRHIARKQKPMIISTGMAYLEEVAHAVRVIQEEGNNQVIILHCVGLYPPKHFEDLNFRVIPFMSDAFGLPIGFSDHTAPGTLVAPLGAVALGACVIEKHFTLDQKGGAPDDANSLNPQQFKQMVDEVRMLEAALKGSGIKQPVVHGLVPGEDEVVDRWARRSIYAARDIAAGEVVTEADVITLRPWGGIEPENFKLVENKKVTKAIRAREPLTFDHFFA